MHTKKEFMRLSADFMFKYCILENATPGNKPEDNLTSESYRSDSHFFRSRTCPNVTDLNCLISYEFFRKKEKMPYKWRKRTKNIKNLQI